MAKKYIHPSLNIVVPPKERLKVYQEAKKYLKAEPSSRFNDNKDKIVDELGVCMLLPCLLWNLDSYLDNIPESNRYWSYSDTVLAFPEFTDKDIDYITSFRSLEARKKARYKVMNKAVKEVNKILKSKV
jgi:hypothetical protein